MARVFSNIRSFYETLFPTAAGIGSLSECNELSEQALFRVASLRGAFLFNKITFLLETAFVQDIAKAG